MVLAIVKLYISTCLLALVVRLAHEVSDAVIQTQCPSDRLHNTVFRVKNHGWTMQYRQMLTAQCYRHAAWICTHCTAAPLVDVRRETNKQTVPSGMLLWRSLRCAQALPQHLELLVDVKKSEEENKSAKGPSKFDAVWQSCEDKLQMGSSFLVDPKQVRKWTRDKAKQGA